MTAMVEVKASEATGGVLDWLVAKAASRDVSIIDGSDGCKALVRGKNVRAGQPWSPSSNWSQGGPLIDRHRVSVSPISVEVGSYAFRMAGCVECWKADKAYSGAGTLYGPTTLIAAMRAIVVSELGETVRVPVDLIEAAA